MDTLRKVLEYNGYKVEQVMNITDVGHMTSDADSGEDKMEKSARIMNMSVYEIAEKFTKLFMNDIKSLNVKLPEQKGNRRIHKKPTYRRYSKRSNNTERVY